MQTIMLKTDDPRLYEASPEKLADFRAQLHQHLTNERPELAAGGDPGSRSAPAEGRSGGLNGTPR